VTDLTAHKTGFDAGAIRISRIAFARLVCGHSAINNDEVIGITSGAERIDVGAKRELGEVRIFFTEDAELPA